MWGPVPLNGPFGAAPGYVVLMQQQPAQPVALTVERQYLPGVGMVREVVVQARNGVMLTRWESVLMRKPWAARPPERDQPRAFCAIS
jgi:hypothetical protein